MMTAVMKKHSLSVVLGCLGSYSFTAGNASYYPCAGGHSEDGFGEQMQKQKIQ
jgi:hypothetical protein